MRNIILSCLIITLISCNTKAQEKKDQNIKKYPITKTDAEWKDQLTKMQYYVLREKGTEKAFSGKYNKHYKKGTYTCAGCDTKLYESDHKFDSRSGWPSFDRGYDKNLEYETDDSHGMKRTELLCATCGGHLGHIFDDGPQKTTGKRHCINSAALKFIPNEE